MQPEFKSWVSSLVTWIFRHIGESNSVTFFFIKFHISHICPFICLYVCFCFGILDIKYRGTSQLHFSAHSILSLLDSSLVWFHFYLFFFPFIWSSLTSISIFLFLPIGTHFMSLVSVNSLYWYGFHWNICKCYFR